MSQLGWEKVYDKLCVLEDKVEVRHTDTAVRLAELGLRVEHLEKNDTNMRSGRRALWIAWISPFVSIGLFTAALLAK